MRASQVFISGKTELTYFNSQKMIRSVHALCKPNQIYCQKKRYHNFYLSYDVLASLFFCEREVENVPCLSLQRFSLEPFFLLSFFDSPPFECLMFLCLTFVLLL